MIATAREPDSTEVLALIPARSGSKGVVDKNIRYVAGKPLIAHSIEQALACPSIGRVLVSTDSERYAEIARAWGAEVPFMRPARIAEDLSTDLEVFEHALTWLSEHEGYTPELIVHLRPTHPVRRVEDIERAVQVMRDDDSLDSLRSVVPAPMSPCKMWFRSHKGLLSQASTIDEIRDSHSAPRQLLPRAFAQNAAIDVVRWATIMEEGSIAGSRIHGFVMDEDWDIDDAEQFRRAERYLNRSSNPIGPESERLTFCFDIDGVVATLVPDNDYRKARPRPKVISLMRRLSAMGHRLVLFTARGYVTGVDWAEVTRQQMDAWGVPFDDLQFGKPAADYYVDDKAVELESLPDLVDRIDSSR